jgi:PEP-CTERM motif-containing protein
VTGKRNLWLLAGCASIVALTTGEAAAQNVTNGSFEAVQIGSPFVSTNPADIPGWTHTGTVGDGLLWAIGYTDGGGSVTVAGQGNQFVTLGGGYLTAGSATWATTITNLTIGKTYDLNFDIAFEGGDTPLSQQVMTVSFASGSSTGASNFDAPFTSGNYWKVWLPETDVFAATAASAVVDFSVNNQINDMGLDNVSVSLSSAIPEPSTWVMLLLGFAGLGFVGYRASRGSAEIVA